jgi:hypothetical protein
MWLESCVDSASFKLGDRRGVEIFSLAANCSRTMVDRSLVLARTMRHPATRASTINLTVCGMMSVGGFWAYHQVVEDINLCLGDCLISCCVRFQSIVYR